MAKSKKKQRKSKPSQRPKIPPQKIDFKAVPNDFLFQNPEIISEQLFRQGHAPMCIAGLQLRQHMKNKFGDTDAELDALFHKADILGHIDERGTVAEIKTICKEYLDKHVRLDETLNIYHDQSDWESKPDILDFRDYVYDKNDPESIHHDVLKSGAYYPVTYRSPALLWTPDVYTLLQFTDSVFYILRRDGFDAALNAVTYTGVAYQRLTLFASQEFILPIVVFNITATISTLDFVDASNNEAEQSIYRMYAEHIPNALNAVEPGLGNALKNNPNNTHVVCFRMNGVNSLWNILDYYHKHYKHKPNHKEMHDLLIHLATECASTGHNFKTDTDIYLLTKQHISIPLQLIVIMNGMLHEERLSKPDRLGNFERRKTTSASGNSNITYVTGTPKLPVRRTRHIGNIHVSTRTRPVKPTLERIICFTKAEWSVSGYTRRTKTGKLVAVKPTTAHRKCVNMSGIDQADSLGVKYIIHPESSNNKGV